MAITFDSFKNLVSQKSPAYISISGNTVTLKKGYYLFNEVMVFPTYPDKYMDTPGSKVYGTLYASVGELVYTTLNTDILSSKRKLGIYLRQLNDISKSQVFFYEYFPNLDSDNASDYFGYIYNQSIAAGWTEPRARVLRITDDVSATYQQPQEGVSYSYSAIFNLCIHFYYKY